MKRGIVKKYADYKTAWEWVIIRVFRYDFTIYYGIFDIINPYSAFFEAGLAVLCDNFGICPTQFLGLSETNQSQNTSFLAPLRRGFFI